MRPRPTTNVAHRIEAIAARDPERTAITVRRRDGLVETVTFADLQERATRTAAGWMRRGLEAGDRAIVMVPMSIALYEVLTSLWAVGAVAVFFDPWMGRRAITSVAGRVAPRAFVGTPRACRLRWLAAPLRRIPLAVTTGRSRLLAAARHRLVDLRDVDGAILLDDMLHALRPEDPALVTFTTGSSGRPKGANRTHGFLMAQHRALRACFPYDADDVDMTAFPIFALNNLALGVPTVVPPVDFARVAETDPRTLHRAAAVHGVTTCTLSPPLLDRLADGVERHGGLALRRILVGGAPIADAQLRRWLEVFRGSEILVIYGSTEAQPIAVIRAEERLAAAGGDADADLCLGTPVAGMDVRIVHIHRGPIRLDDRGWDAWAVPNGEVGELVVAGDAVCRDYFDDPEATEAGKIVDADGRVWHRTGDTGYVDAAGRLRFVGRLHTTIRRGGEDLHAQRIERKARRHLPTGRRVAALGLDGDGDDERLVVVVEGPLAEAERHVLRAGLAAEGCAPDEVVVSAEALPVDPRHNAKIDHRALRARIARELGRRP